MKTISLFLFLQLFILLLFAQNPCPVGGGSSKPKFQHIDSLKNRSFVENVFDSTISLERILSTPTEAEQRTDINRFTSNQYVKITGYVILIKPGGDENCNCHSKEPKDADIHIELALHPNDDDKHAMIVEINRFIKTNNPDYTVVNLKKNLLGKKVIVEGYMFPDEEHKQSAVASNPNGANNWRFTIWEVHPVVKISLAE